MPYSGPSEHKNCSEIVDDSGASKIEAEREALRLRAKAIKSGKNREQREAEKVRKTAIAQGALLEVFSTSTPDIQDRAGSAEEHRAQRDLDAYIEHQEHRKARDVAHGHVAPNPGSDGICPSPKTTPILASKGGASSPCI